MFSVRSTVLKAALADPETNKKLEKAESWQEMQRILIEFAEKNKLTIKEIKEVKQ